MLTAVEHWAVTDEAPPMRPGAVHLWRARLEATRALRDLLSPAEWVRAERFHFDRDSERFVATRGLVRTILGSYTQLPASSLAFRIGRHGKPELDGPASTLRFNLSHSDDLLLLAVTHVREIGVDLEFMRHDLPFETLADHYFDPEEAWELRQLPKSQRAWKFYDVWTCTEARLKAGGVGLAEGARVAEPDRWAMLKLTPSAGYTAAMAVDGADFQLECCSWPQ